LTINFFSFNKLANFSNSENCYPKKFIPSTNDAKTPHCDTIAILRSVSQTPLPAMISSQSRDKKIGPTNIEPIFYRGDCLSAILSV